MKRSRDELVPDPARRVQGRQGSATGEQGEGNFSSPSMSPTDTIPTGASPSIQLPAHQPTLPPISSGSQLSAAAAVAAAAQAAHAAAQPPLPRSAPYMDAIATDVAAFAASHQNRFAPTMGVGEPVSLMQQGLSMGPDGYALLKTGIL